MEKYSTENLPHGPHLFNEVLDQVLDQLRFQRFPDGELAFPVVSGPWENPLVVERRAYLRHCTSSDLRLLFRGSGLTHPWIRMVLRYCEGRLFKLADHPDTTISFGTQEIAALTLLGPEATESLQGYCLGGFLIPFRQGEEPPNIWGDHPWTDAEWASLRTAAQSLWT